MTTATAIVANTNFIHFTPSRKKKEPTFPIPFSFQHSPEAQTELQQSRFGAKAKTPTQFMKTTRRKDQHTKNLQKPIKTIKLIIFSLTAASSQNSTSPHFLPPTNTAQQPIKRAPKQQDSELQASYPDHEKQHV